LYLQDCYVLCHYIERFSFFEKNLPWENANRLPIINFGSQIEEEVVSQTLHNFQVSQPQIEPIKPVPSKDKS
jgi:hypothetical protein